MWHHESKRAKTRLTFPELEQKLAEANAKVRRESSKKERHSETVIYQGEFRDKLSFITKKNKPRSILVLDRSDKKSEIVMALLEANSEAMASCARTIAEAKAMLKSNHYDMVYIVTDMTDGDVCRGPCFFSLQEDQQHKRFHHFVEDDVKALRPEMNGSEVIAICSGDDCPHRGHDYLEHR